LPGCVHGLPLPDWVQPPTPTKIAFACVLLAPAPVNEIDCGPVMFEDKVQVVVLTAALPLKLSPPPKASEHAIEGVVSAATATSVTLVGPFPMIRAVKLRGTARTMVAWTALHDDEQVPVASAPKLPLLQVPGWIVTVALLDPDV